MWRRGLEDMGVENRIKKKKKKKKKRAATFAILFAALPVGSSLPSPDLLPSFLLLHSSISPSLSLSFFLAFLVFIFFLFSSSPQIVISRFSYYPLLGSQHLTITTTTSRSIQLSHISHSELSKPIQGVFCLLLAGDRPSRFSVHPYWPLLPLRLGLTPPPSPSLFRSSY